MHFEGPLPLVARDREPGVRASAAGHGPGRSLDAVGLELREHLADEVGLALERKLHARGNIHPSSVGGGSTQRSNKAPNMPMPATRSSIANVRCSAACGMREATDEPTTEPTMPISANVPRIV